ncbi:MAG: lamin tail domain-containing protein, partial [Gemmatimonadales bacterium]
MVTPAHPEPPRFSMHSGPPAVRISEFHYDNDGTDVGEAIEIEGPAGTDLTGWSVVLYNGNGGTAYDTRTLSATIVERCGGRGVALLTYPSNGIQNGSPDGLALVDA